MFAKISSLGLFGMEAFHVEVEADTSGGLPRFDIVGLPDTAVNESKERVRAAMKNCGYKYPVSRITINLLPADIRKEGPLYDLPILIALLITSDQLKADVADSAFLGALSLNGSLQRVNGVLPMAIQAKQSGIKRLFVPSENAAEAAVVKGLEVYAVRTVHDLIAHLTCEKQLEPAEPNEQASASIQPEPLDFADVKGQQEARRAMEVAAAGGHNILLIGPPGSGKSMLAKRLPSILPEMTFEESIETTKIHSIAGKMQTETALITNRPFRAPHHTSSRVGLVGGGTVPRPGELSLAHNGVLFLDELPEFSRDVMETLRQPIEEGAVSITRSAGIFTFPCRVMLVAAMNPCKCGYYGHPTRDCTCSASAADTYRKKVSGPLLDRIDLHIDVQPVEYDALSSRTGGESSKEIRKRVNTARAIQTKRFEDKDINCNAQMDAAMTKTICKLTPDAETLLRQAFERLGFTARAYDRVLRVARTIADLDAAKKIEVGHIAEAIQYRSLDRKYWS